MIAPFLLPRSALRSAPVLVTALSLLAAACALETPTGQDDAVLLEGNLVSVDPNVPVSGSAAALTQFGNTDVSIGAEGLEAGSSHGWRFREGTCTDEGGLVGSTEWYTDIEANEDGAASAVLRGLPVELRRGRSYAAELLQEAGHEGPVLACADLEERQF